MDRRVIEPKCHVCKKSSDKRLSLNIQDKNGRITVYLCDKCYFRLPSDITRQLFYNSSNMSGEEVNGLVLGALKNTPPKKNLSNGFCLQFESQFRVYGSRDKMIEAIRLYKGSKVLGKFVDGKKIS